MYKGKHSSKTTMKFSKKSIIMLIALALILTVGAGSTLAYLITDTDPVTNVFTVPESSIRVEEDFDGNTKNNVCVSNSSDYPVYIRASVIVTWQDKDGNVYGQMPKAGTNYTISYNLNETNPLTGEAAENVAYGVWDDGSDGYYYYTGAVEKGEKTDQLIVTCTPVGNPPAEGYDLHVEILAQAIQSQPAKAVDSWDNEKVNLTGNADGTVLTVTNK
ncbi:MAG: hypothetical protein E7195_02770 [Peptococcaceae bacterium]|nr:hypothetical protein [Peptococcaceae bacterium]